MAGETLDFADGFDNVYLLRHELESILRQFISLIMFMDFRSGQTTNLFNFTARFASGRDATK
jgi:hypothetical protein